jgi:hypothetical protein
MIKYTYDVDLGQYTRRMNGKYCEEHRIVESLKSGRNVLLEYNTKLEAKKARAAIMGRCEKTGKKISTSVTGTKVLVVVLP